MTPQEIADHKMRWMPGHAVQIHIDLADAGKTWCRRNLERHQWSFKTWTAVYAHTFYFEDIVAAQNFSVEFADWIKK